MEVNEAVKFIEKCVSAYINHKCSTDKIPETREKKNSLIALIKGPQGISNVKEKSGK